MKLKRIAPGVFIDPTQVIAVEAPRLMHNHRIHPTRYTGGLIIRLRGGTSYDATDFTVKGEDTVRDEDLSLPSGRVLEAGSIQKGYPDASQIEDAIAYLTEFLNKSEED